MFITFLIRKEYFLTPLPPTHLKLAALSPFLLKTGHSTNYLFNPTKGTVVFMSLVALAA